MSAQAKWLAIISAWAVGIACGWAGAAYFGPRYVLHSGPGLWRFDQRTGQAWRLDSVGSGHAWEPVHELPKSEIMRGERLFWTALQRRVKEASETEKLNKLLGLDQPLEFLKPDDAPRPK